MAGWKRGCRTAGKSADSATLFREKMMADLFLLIGNKKYSSWSLRPWLVLKQAGFSFDETLESRDRPDTPAQNMKF
jgi:hypothetical protein